MKKLAIAAAVAALATGGAHAYTVGTFSNGFVVPNVYFDANETTAVGLINQTGTNAAVYWTFFDVNSNHITDGCIRLTDKDYEPFNWSAMAGNGLSGVRGYLTFAVGANTVGAAAQTVCGASAQLSGNGQISGNAFQVNVTGKSVAFVPVIDGPLQANTDDLTTWGPASLERVAGAAQISSAGLNTDVQQRFSLRYFIDGAAAGTDTRVVVWSTGVQKKAHTVNIYDDKQERKSVNFVLANDELDFFDPETIVGRPAHFLDGFIDWPVSRASLNNGTVANTTGGSIIAYSVISAPSFGAVQTILGSHR